MGPTHRSPSKRPKRLQRTDGVTQTSMFFLVGSKPFCVRCEWDGRQGTKPQALGAQQSQTDARVSPINFTWEGGTYTPHPHLCRSA